MIMKILQTNQNPVMKVMIHNQIIVMMLLRYWLELSQLNHLFRRKLLKPLGKSLRSTIFHLEVLNKKGVVHHTRVAEEIKEKKVFLLRDSHRTKMINLHPSNY